MSSLTGATFAGVGCERGRAGRAEAVGREVSAPVEVVAHRLFRRKEFPDFG
jgi:hypothetical protein